MIVASLPDALHDAVLGGEHLLVVEVEIVLDAVRHAAFGIVEGEDAGGEVGEFVHDEAFFHELVHGLHEVGDHFVGVVAVAEIQVEDGAQDLVAV